MNRAISNLVGGGEVSAEEVMTGRRRVDSKQRNVKKKTKEKKNTEIPQVDPDEEQVNTILKVNGIPVDDLTIYKWLDKVRIVPKTEFPQENLDAYNDAITSLLKAKWVAKEKWWEVSC